MENLLMLMINFSMLYLSIAQKLVCIGFNMFMLCQSVMNDSDF